MAPPNPPPLYGALASFAKTMTRKYFHSLPWEWKHSKIRSNEC
jgi:hypothetical protein